MDWIRRNPTAIPWTLLGVDIGIRIGIRLYKAYNGRFQDEAVYESPPLSDLPKSAQQEIINLPYPPDAYPGARDVTSSYGSLRVYEWGPEEGQKVLLIHGITNPCVALGGVAEQLVSRGCRVMLFDLPGRGYSSSPHDIPQSARFFTTCILLAISSSPISWTGGTRNKNNKFSLIGYSLGGGVAIDFTSHFSALIHSLILLAPSGLVRTGNINLSNKFLYNSGLVNEVLLEKIITHRVQTGAPPVAPRKPQPLSDTKTVAETQKSTDPSNPCFSIRYPGMVLPDVLKWQVQANRGFVPAYISSMRYGPISNQHESWAHIGQLLDVQKQHASIESSNQLEGLKNGKVLVICGTTDALVIGPELKEDLSKCLGEEGVELAEVDAGHDLPMKRYMEIAELISEFWSR